MAGYRIVNGKSSGLKSDGGDDTVIFPYNPLIDFSLTNPYTISKKFRNIGSGVYFLFQLRPNSNPFWLTIAVLPNLVLFYTGNSNSGLNDFIQLVVTLTPQKYYEDIVATVTYDGVDKYTFTVNNTTVVGNKVLSIVPNNKILSFEPINANFLGIRKDMKIWNRELTPIEVANIHNNNTYPSDSIFNTEFDNSQGFILTDKANGYNGTLSGYNLTEVTQGINNSWLYKDEAPYRGQGDKMTNYGKILSNRNVAYGLALNGSDNYVQVPTGGLQTNYNDTFSISCSVKINAIINTFNTLFIGNETLPFGVFFYIDTSANRLSLTLFNNGGTGETWQCPFILTTTTIYNLSVTYNAGICMFYINGEQLSPTVNFRFGGYDGTQNTTQPLGYTVAARPSIGFYVNSIFYDLKVFNKNLTLTEATELGTYNRTPTTAQANLVTHLGFNALNGLTVLDKSGNGNNGTLVGYNSGETPLRDIQGSVVTQYSIP